MDMKAFVRTWAIAGLVIVVVAAFMVVGPTGVARDPSVAAIFAATMVLIFAFACWEAYRRARRAAESGPTQSTSAEGSFPGVLTDGVYPHAVRFRGWDLARELFVCALVAVVAGMVALQPLLGGYPPPMMFQAVGWLALGWCGYRLWQLRSPWLILYSDHLEKRGLTGWISLNRADIDGLRTWSDRSGSWIELLPKTPGQSVFDRIVLRRSVRDDPVGKRWLSGLRDLDVVAAAAVKAEVLNDARFGETVGSREARLKQARVVALTFDGVCVAIGVWLYFWPPANIVTLGVTAVAIAAGFALIQASQGLLVWLDPTRVRPPVLGAFAPTVAMAILGLDRFHVLNLGGFWVLVVLLTLALVAFVYVRINAPSPAAPTIPAPGSRTASAASNPIRILWGVAFAGMFLFFGAMKFVNAALDTSKVQVYPVTVQDKQISSGRSTNYSIDFGPWSDQPAGKVTIPSSFYYEISVGSTVCFFRQSGAVGFSWFRVDHCPAGVQAPA